MKNHKYKISVNHIEDKDGNPVSGRSFDFIVENHDEIIEIIGRIQNTNQFEGDDAAAFAVGLKLFGEVMLKNKDNLLFTEFKPHFIEFMKKLKSSARDA